MRRAQKGILGVFVSSGVVGSLTASLTLFLLTGIVAFVAFIGESAIVAGRIERGRRPLRIGRVGGRVKIFRAVDPQHLHELEIEEGLAVDEMAQLREERKRKAREHSVNWRARQARPVDLRHRRVTSRLPHGFFGASHSGGATFVASGGVVTRAPLHAVQHILDEKETMGIVLPVGATILLVKPPLIKPDTNRAWDQAMALQRAGAISTTALRHALGRDLPYQ